METPTRRPLFASDPPTAPREVENAFSDVPIDLSINDDWTPYHKGLLVGLKRCLTKDITWAEIQHRFGGRCRSGLQRVVAEAEDGDWACGHPGGHVKHALQVCPKVVLAPGEKAISRRNAVDELATMKHAETDENVFPTVTSIQQHLSCLGYDVSWSTVQRDLEYCRQHLKLRERKGISVPLISNVNKKKRFEFCDWYQTHSYQYDNIHYLDESTFYNRPKNVLHRDHHGDPDHYHMRSQSKVRCMIFAGIGTDGLRWIYNMADGKANGFTCQRAFVDYRNLVRSDRWYSDNDHLKVMFDNAPAHNAIKMYCDWNGVDWQGHPPQSPDLNPIENMFGIMKYKWERLLCRRRVAKAEMFPLLKEIFMSIPQETVNKAIRSMPKRLEWVRDNDGKACRY